jgi:hypothetical protein
MKRTATTLVLLAGLGGGGCATSDQQQVRQAPPAPQPAGFGAVTRGKEVTSVQGPLGEPVMAVRGAMPGGGVRPAGGTLLGSGGVRTAAVTPADNCTSCMVPGAGGTIIRTNHSQGGAPVADYGPPPGFGAGAAGPYGPQSGKGILPVPTMGPPGAVAAVGALGMPGSVRSPMVNGRSSINFTGPAGMKVTWQLPDGSFNDEANALTAPKEYNFLQGQVYRLRLTSILPDHPGKSFYPTLEVAPANPKSLTFLSHSSVPVTFGPDDFAQARAGNLVVKVIYLPDPANQDFSTVVGAEEVVSTRLEPGADPVAEAQRRGTILAVIRMGNIDLENRVSPAMTAPPPGLMPLPFPAPVPVPGGPVPVPPKSGPAPKLGAIEPNFGAIEPPLAPTAPISANPPGTASVRPPAALPPLPLSPTDRPPAPLGPKAK